MITFKDFFSKQESSQKAELLSDSSSNTVAKNVVAALASVISIDGVLLSTSQKEKFSTHVGELVTDKNFIGELSSRIGLPIANESESDFVCRAKDSMRKLLKDKLKG